MNYQKQKKQRLGKENIERGQNQIMTIDQVGVCIVIVITLGIARGTVEPGGDLLDDYGADSLDIVELVMCLEEEYDIEIPDDAVQEFELRKVDNIIKYLNDNV